jgi:peptidoglycan/xylan/chitin deacetylase (PgdA/CDA1 family)
MRAAGLIVRPRVRRIRCLVVGVVLALGATATSAGAASSSPAPTPIVSSSLIQATQQLAWTVTLASPLSQEAGRRTGDRLCLLVERPDNGSVSGQVCVAPPSRRGGRSPQLTFQRVTARGPGLARAITATVRPAGSRRLTASFLPGAIGNPYRTLRWQTVSTLAAPPCTPPRLGATRCAVPFPARPALLRLHAPQLVGCTADGPSLVYDRPAAGREIALTFDDGPWYQTPAFLTLLEHYETPATFFQIGRQISEFGEEGAIERRMLADGDMIGDHTWSHADVAGAGAFARSQIEDAAAAIRGDTGGFEPCLFRAPSGALSPTVIAEARDMGFTTIQWNIDPRDWARPGVGEIESNVIDNARPGAIVEMHDGGGDRSQTLAALPDIITTLRGRGYRFVTVTQLLGQRLVYR